MDSLARIEYNPDLATKLHQESIPSQGEYSGKNEAWKVLFYFTREC